MWHSNDRYRREIWRCDSKYERKGHVYDSPHFTEKQLETVTMKAINDIQKDRKAIINETESVLTDLFDTSPLLEKRAGLEAKINEVSDKAKELIDRNSRTVQNQDEYQKEYSRLSDEYHKLKEKLDAVDAAITDKETRRTRAKEFIAILRKFDTITDSFPSELFLGLIERMTVISKDEIRVEFRNGTAAAISI